MHLKMCWGGGRGWGGTDTAPAARAGWMEAPGLCSASRAGSDFYPEMF